MHNIQRHTHTERDTHTTRAAERSGLVESEFPPEQGGDAESFQEASTDSEANIAVEKNGESSREKD